MPGEEEHVKGAEAVQRVKRWLEGTMRVSQSYTNTDGAWARKLTLHWPYGNAQPFSYDLGGMMRGGEWEGDLFCAEVKWRRNASEGFRVQELPGQVLRSTSLGCSAELGELTP